MESRDGAARIAFRQMATAWARLAFNEEFTTPLDERIDPPISGISETTPVKKAGGSSDHPVFGRYTDGDRARLDETTQETVLAAKPLFKGVGQVGFALSTTLADLFKKAREIRLVPVLQGSAAELDPKPLESDGRLASLSECCCTAAIPEVTGALYVAKRALSYLKCDCKDRLRHHSANGCSRMRHSDP